jgi:hypothetical protein
MTLAERLSEAATALRERVDPHPVSLEKRRAARRHDRRVVGVLALLLVVIVAGALVLLRDTTSSPRVGVSGGSGAPTVSTTTAGAPTDADDDRVRGSTDTPRSRPGEHSAQAAQLPLMEDRVHALRCVRSVEGAGGTVSRMPCCLRV